MNKKIWISPPHLNGNEIEYIQDAFNKNWVTNIGENIDCFELDLKLYLGAAHEIVALNSCTSALHLALVQCGVGYGDEVICQSMTFSASANPIIYQGAIPIFIDSEIDTWNICPKVLEEAINDRIKKGKKPKAIIAVHLYGTPFKVDEVLEVANKYSIPVIEDAAGALGSSYKGQKCGTFGRFGALSFNGNKIITTSGGGALVCRSEKDKNKSIFLATQARDDAPHYQHSEIGYNYRISNICAGIGRAQMEVLDGHVTLRRNMNTFYCDIFSKVEGITVFKVPNENYYSNCWLSTILIDPSKTNGKTREDFRLYLEAQNIESRPLWKPMHLQPVFEKYPYYGSNVAEQLFENGLCLPSGSNLNGDDRGRLKLAIHKFF